jgi:predicted nucleic acid-binding protein
MERIDFNRPEFKGFEQGEDILVDTCILLALTGEKDPWHKTVSELFEKHIFPDEKLVLLYTNPLIVNEVLHLSTKSFSNFAEKFGTIISATQYKDIEDFVENMLITLIEEGVLQVLDGDKDSILKQIVLKKHLGAADASNASIANLYGTNFLTIDIKLANNIQRIETDLPNIKKIYCTTPQHKTYF